MALQPSLFLESIIAFLVPYFAFTTEDIDAARTEIIATLADYAARTRAEVLQAAQIIALGMTTLDTLAEAKAADFSPSMRIRYRGCANNLNRSTLQTEKALDQRLACDPPAARPLMEPVDDLPDAELPGAIEHARAAIDLHRSRLAAARPATVTHPVAQIDEEDLLWAGSLSETMKRVGLPNGSPQAG